MSQLEPKDHITGLALTSSGTGVDVDLSTLQIVATWMTVVQCIAPTKPSPSAEHQVFGLSACEDLKKRKILSLKALPPSTNEAC